MKIRKTNLECVVESTASLFGAVHRPGRRGSHTSQKARCMRHPRLGLAARAHPNGGGEEIGRASCRESGKMCADGGLGAKESNCMVCPGWFRRRSRGSALK